MIKLAFRLHLFVIGALWCFNVSAAAQNLTGPAANAEQWNQCLKSVGPDKDWLEACSIRALAYFGMTDQLSDAEMKSAKFINNVKEILAALNAEKKNSSDHLEKAKKKRAFSKENLKEIINLDVRNSFIDAAERLRLRGDEKAYRNITNAGFDLPGLRTTNQSKFLEWKVIDGGPLPNNAISAGISNGKSRFLCRAPISGTLKTGWIDEGKCKVPDGENSTEADYTVFEVLIGEQDSVAWQQNIDGHDLPVAAFLNITYENTDFYVCRDKSITINGDQIEEGAPLPGTLSKLRGKKNSKCKMHQDAGVTSTSHFEVMIIKEPGTTYEPKVLFY